MENKDQLKEAVMASSQYSPKQRQLLCLLLDLEIKDVVSITPQDLAGLLKTSKTSIYLSLKRLEKDRLITIVTEKGKHFCMYELHALQIEKLLEYYIKRKNVIEGLKNKII